jgi:hypothetical protein
VAVVINLLIALVLVLLVAGLILMVWLPTDERKPQKSPDQEKWT